LVPSGFAATVRLEYRRMSDDTRIGGPSAKFPATRRSAIVASYSGRPEERRQALDRIVAAYWKPVYTFIRMRWHQSNEDAKDLTQAFFARAMEKETFRDYDSTKASFRTFVRTCVTHFVINESKYAHRQKRAGDADAMALDDSIDPPGMSLEESFEKEWIRSLFSLAVDDLKELCAAKNKPVHFALFERYDLEHADAQYADLARESGIAVTDVTNYLSWSRKEFRRLIMDRIRDITVDDAEFRREVRLILGSGA
jgi:RNA polymerase sigma factor (sigma-70 family)